MTLKICEKFSQDQLKYNPFCAQGMDKTEHEKKGKKKQLQKLTKFTINPRLAGIKHFPFVQKNNKLSDEYSCY